MHDNVGRVHEVRRSTERSFGYVMAAFFALVALAPVVQTYGAPRWWAVGVAAAFAILARFWPAPLAPLNRLWMRLGLLLHRVVSPIALALVFYATILPVGLLMRIVGRDRLGLAADRSAQSYWIKREPIDASPDSMKNQF